MVEFKEYADKLKTMYQLDYRSFYEDFVRFLVDNDWFNITPVWDNGMLLIDPNDFQPLLPSIERYFKMKSLDTDDKNKSLLDLLSRNYPETASKLKLFYDTLEIPSEIAYNLSGFLLKFLSKEIFMMNDDEIQQLLTLAFNELSKRYGDILTFFLSWLKEHFKTKYLNDYSMEKRCSDDSRNDAYDLDEYLELLYYLFNEDYIIENDMYVKAAQSKNFIDTWLFLSLHFICALRNSDIVRIYHPRLTMPAEDVLKRVAEGTFSDEDARLTLYSITWRLSSLPLTPNKTKKHGGISSIKLCVPESVEVHMGTLFAIAEAHRLLNNVPDDTPLIRIISDYDRISRYMGDEIGALFLESNFKSRAANKSYLQSIFMLTDDILKNDDEFNTKGYILAALARSHKGSYGEFAATTATYLKDAKLSGLTPEYVAMELFERGVLSFIPSMLLKIITEGNYNTLPVHKQTLLIQELNLTPGEIENIVALSNRAEKQSAELIEEILNCSGDDKKSHILWLLHRIANGDAVSKQGECLCLMTAMKKFCCCQDRTNCIGCKYEISTKSTVFLMVSEYNRLLMLYNNSPDERLKMKYKSLITETVLPTLDELFQCIQEQYGKDALLSLEKIIKENANA